MPSPLDALRNARAIGADPNPHPAAANALNALVEGFRGFVGDDTGSTASRVGGLLAAAAPIAGLKKYLGVLSAPEELGSLTGRVIPPRGQISVPEGFQLGEGVDPDIARSPILDYTRLKQQIASDPTQAGQVTSRYVQSYRPDEAAIQRLQMIGGDPENYFRKINTPPSPRMFNNPERQREALYRASQQDWLSNLPDDIKRQIQEAFTPRQSGGRLVGGGSK